MKPKCKVCGSDDLAQKTTIQKRIDRTVFLSRTRCRDCRALGDVQVLTPVTEYVALVWVKRSAGGLSERTRETILVEHSSIDRWKDAVESAAVIVERPWKDENFPMKTQPPLRGDAITSPN